MITVVPIDTPSLGTAATSPTTGIAFVVDPQRDIHNDYVTGGLALAQEVGAEYLVNADDESPSTAPRSATVTSWRSAR